MHIKEEICHTIIIEKSKFIAYLKPLKTIEAYKDYLKEIRKFHYDATHVCSALILDNVKRSNDDGEPSGTAGMPILNVLEKNHLNNICALVVRYFGGVKLGAGGLIRAYGGVVNEALKQATIVEEISYPKYQIKLAYDVANKLDNLLNKNTLYLNKSYDDEVIIDFVLKDETALNKISEITKGQEPILIGQELIEKVVE